MTRPQLPSDDAFPIGGLQKLSLVDYPGRPATALFTIGCNMRCGYCHNPELVLPERYAPSLPLTEIVSFLESRKGKVEAVVISGGEPTMHEGLPQFCRVVKNMDFLIKLDSNGTEPGILKQLHEEALLDYIAMDIKAPLEKYSLVTQRPINLDAIQESIDFLKTCGLPHEFRTTIVRSQLDLSDIEAMGKMARGGQRYALQYFRPGRTLMPQLANAASFSDAEMAEAKTIMQRYVADCVVH